MPQPTLDTRPEEEALAILLILAALGVGGFYTVAKTVGNLFIGAKLKKKPHRPQANKDSASFNPSDLPKVEDQNNDPGLRLAGCPSLQISSSQDDFDRTYEEGLNAISAWEEATIGHIHSAKARTFDALSSLDEETQLLASDTVADCEKSLMRSVRREKKRRLEHLASQGDRDREREEGLEAIRVWEKYTVDRIQRQKARKYDHISLLDAQGDDKAKVLSKIREWEGSTIGSFQKEKTRRLERLPPLPDKANERMNAFFESLLWGEKPIMSNFERETKRYFLSAETRKKRHISSSVATKKAHGVEKDGEDVEEDVRVVLWKTGKR